MPPVQNSHVLRSRGQYSNDDHGGNDGKRITTSNKKNQNNKKQKRDKGRENMPITTRNTRGPDNEENEEEEEEEVPEHAGRRISVTVAAQQDSRNSGRHEMGSARMARVSVHQDNHANVYAARAATSRDDTLNNMQSPSSQSHLEQMSQTLRSSNHSQAGSSMTPSIQAEVVRTSNDQRSHATQRTNSSGVSRNEVSCSEADEYVKWRKEQGGTTTSEDIKGGIQRFVRDKLFSMVKFITSDKDLEYTGTYAGRQQGLWRGKQASLVY